MMKDRKPRIDVPFYIYLVRGRQRKSSTERYEQPFYYKMNYYNFDERK